MRIVSEFGFQSYPHPATIAAVTEPGDRDLASPVMDAHQKATAAGATGNAELARQLVKRLHGEDAAALAEEDFNVKFRKRDVPEDVPEAFASKPDDIVETLGL